MIGWHEDGDNLDRLEAHEAKLGKRFAVVRLYNQWRQPSRKVDQMVADGRLVLSSHKGPDPGRGGWAAVASGRQDGTIRFLAQKYRGYGRQIIFVFHHEPHDDASDVKRSGRYGTSSDFKAAWRRIHRIFTDEGASASAGGTVFFGYSATGSRALGNRGSGDPLYPGDAYVDVFAHDRYNWASCRGEGWESFAENWRPLVELAAEHGKPLIPAELGAPPSGGRRNAWFRDAARWMKTDPLARQWMIGFAYYHSFHDSCHWDFMNQGDDGRSGWAEAFSGDGYFVETPFSLHGSAMAVRSAGPGPGPSVPPAEPARAGEPAPAGSVSWAPPTRQEGGLPPGHGEVSGIAASKRYPGWAWAIRDSGNPASLYALRERGGIGRFSMREFPVRGASNRDWEDVVYAADATGTYLLIVDAGAKVVYKVAEPDPAASGGALAVARYRYAFPDRSPSSTCGPRDNVEAAFVFPALSGQLHLVRKMGSPARVYRFGELSPDRTNVLVPAGELADAGCISVASLSADSRLLVTASHDRMRVRQGAGDAASLLRAAPRYGSGISPDNNEGGDFFPWGSRDIVVGAENRSTRHFKSQ